MGVSYDQLIVLSQISGENDFYGVVAFPHPQFKDGRTQYMPGIS